MRVDARTRAVCGCVHMCAYRQVCGAAELTSDVRSQLVASAVVQQLLLRTEHPQSQPAAVNHDLVVHRSRAAQ